jgi:hypothetical protein
MLMGLWVTVGQLASALVSLVYGWIFSSTGGFTAIWLLAAGVGGKRAAAKGEVS